MPRERGRNLRLLLPQEKVRNLWLRLREPRQTFTLIILIPRLIFARLEDLQILVVCWMNNIYHKLSVNSLGGESVVIVCHVNIVLLADLTVRKIMAWMHVVVRSSCFVCFQSL